MFRTEAGLPQGQQQWGVLPRTAAGHNWPSNAAPQARCSAAARGWQPTGSVRERGRSEAAARRAQVWPCSPQEARPHSALSCTCPSLFDPGACPIPCRTVQAPFERGARPVASKRGAHLHAEGLPDCEEPLPCKLDRTGEHGRRGYIVRAPARSHCAALHSSSGPCTAGVQLGAVPQP